MEKSNADNAIVQRIAVGTKELFLGFYEGSLEEHSLLKDAIDNPNCEVYTTILNIAELYHLIQEKEGSKEMFLKKFDAIYKKINNCIKVERYCLDENFEKEYAKNYSNNNIFSFALSKFCEDNNIQKCL